MREFVPGSRWALLGCLSVIILVQIGFTTIPALAQGTVPTQSQPVARVQPVVDTYFGQQVVDPYRWMEDITSPEVQAWMKAQNAYTRDYLDHLPDRDALVKRIEALDNAATTVRSMAHLGSRYFYLKIGPRDQTPKLYARDGLHAPERLLADPQTIGGSGKRYTISGFYPAPDGRFVAIEIAAGGSEEGTLQVIDAASAKVLPGVIDRIWGASVAWDTSDKFFYFTRLQKLAPGQSEMDKELDTISYLHQLDPKAGPDIAVLGRKNNPALGLVPTDEGEVSVEPGSPYAIGAISHGVKNELSLYLSPATSTAKGLPQWRKFVDIEDEVTDFTVKGHDIWLLSYKGASRFKMLHLDLDHPDMAKADEVLPMSDLVLHAIGAAHDGLYIRASKGGLSQILRMAYGQRSALPLPLPYSGSVGAFSTNVLEDGALCRISGWTHAPQWFAYHPGDGRFLDTGLEPINPTDFSGMTSQELTAPASDGTLIPLSVIYKKGLSLNGKNSCLIEGYGSYGISIEPSFDATRLALLEKGIIIAYAHVRGGGENGEDWHLAGQKLTKENTISDFIACGQYLVDKGYTSPAYLAGRGTSAGGITIGGALTQRPDLFTLAICNVGVMDALRSEFSPNGPSNIPEFGTVTEAEGFKALYPMDAYQHVKDGTAYPSVLLITGANDPRVSPWELFKMTARLQAATSSHNPILLRIDYDAGHGIGSSKSQRDLILADQTALLLSRCGK